MQQQGTEIIKKAVEYDSQGNCFWKGCNWTGKLREAIEAYKAGSKRLYEALRCNGLEIVLFCSWEKSVCCSEY